MDDRTTARLRWACRRGMLELDLWLQSYLLGAYPRATREEQQAFEQILECHDQDLFDWLMGNTQPTDKKLLPVIDRIRSSSCLTTSPPASCK